MNDLYSECGPFYLFRSILRLACAAYFLILQHNSIPLEPWSSLVKGDEQLDQPNSQTTMELCHASVAYFFGLNTNTTAF